MAIHTFCLVVRTDIGRSRENSCGQCIHWWAARAIAWGRPWGINPTGHKRMSTSIRIKRYSILLVLPKHIAQANMLMAIFDFLIGFRSK
jgi:hypothetical protein